MGPFFMRYERCDISINITYRGNSVLKMGCLHSSNGDNEFHSSQYYKRPCSTHIHCTWRDTIKDQTCKPASHECSNMKCYLLLAHELTPESPCQRFSAPQYLISICSQLKHNYELQKSWKKCLCCRRKHSPHTVDSLQGLCNLRMLFQCCQCIGYKW